MSLRGVRQSPACRLMIVGGSATPESTSTDDRAGWDRKVGGTFSAILPRALGAVQRPEPQPTTRSVMIVRTSVRAGGRDTNHSQAAVARTGVKGGQYNNHSQAPLA
jgi:hypothetical protein